MDSFFRTDDPAEQVKESKLLYLAGIYRKKFNGLAPVVVVPSLRELPANSVMEIIGIVPSKKREHAIYECVRTYAERIAQQGKLEFVNLVKKG